MIVPRNPALMTDEEKQLAGVGQTPAMTLRDWLAGQALVGIISVSHDGAIRDICAGIRGGRPMAYGAYAIADAMLAAREQKA